jgi:hypothetical protein
MLRVGLLLILLGFTGLVLASSLKNLKPFTGAIINENGEPLIGVSIHIEGAQNGTISNKEGNFLLDLGYHFRSSDTLTVIFSYFGYHTEYIRLTTDFQEKNYLIKMRLSGDGPKGGVIGKRIWYKRVGYRIKQFFSRN